MATPERASKPPNQARRPFENRARLICIPIKLCSRLPNSEGLQEGEGKLCPNTDIQSHEGHASSKYLFINAASYSIHYCPK